MQSVYSKLVLRKIVFLYNDYLIDYVILFCYPSQWLSNSYAIMLQFLFHRKIPTYNIYLYILYFLHFYIFNSIKVCTVSNYERNLLHNPTLETTDEQYDSSLVRPAARSNSSLDCAVISAK